MIPPLINTETVINDSMFLSLIYNFGIFGVVIIISIISRTLIQNKTKVPTDLILLILAVLIGGVGSNSIIGFRFDILLPACLFLILIHSRNQYKTQ
jgi:surface polysaccharide O-acyltransferase-like enzyme